MPRSTGTTVGTLLVALLLTSPVVALPEADEEEVMTTLTLSFTNNGRPLNESEKGKFYVYEVGERKNYVAWGHTTRTAEFPEGVYDLIIRYENGEIKETITRREVEFKGDKKEQINFHVPVAHLKIDITRGGLAIEPFTGSYSVYRAGQRDKAVVRKRPGTEITIRPGTYDIEVAHRADDGMKTQWLEGLFVDGSAYQSVELGLPRDQLSQATVTLVEDGRRISPEEGIWRVYDSGQRVSPLGERRSGEMMTIEKGVYDIGAFYTRDGTTEERWLVDVDFGEDLEREIEMGVQMMALRVNVNADGRLQTAAWFSVYPVGQHDNPLVSAQSGEEVQLEPGTYDIGCFLRDGGSRADEWLNRRKIEEPLTLVVDLDHHDAFLRIKPREGRRRGNVGDPRMLIVMDSSSRMRARMGDATRLEVALPAIAEALSAVPANVQVGLRTLGGEPDTARECRASSLRVAPHASDAEALTSALSQLRPTGAAPLTHALDQAVADLPPGPENSLVIVTAGADGCGGNLCTVAARMLRDGLVGRVFVIGFDMDRNQMRRLDCVGEQRLARSGPELTAALRQVIRQAMSVENGTFSVFRSARPSVWVAGGALGDRIKLTAGTYDIEIRSRGRSHSWDSVYVSGNVDVVAGRRFKHR